ncbi:uncharacterized protein N7479_008381 [Penicillium vulpinum]|uniref:uncharacterized protein n=1 Tax=Penicillium vulpinum TaxID=29845 RepID=UPI002548F9E3|nr:uncharacterized protein N7479_008381 [Penicillium vulpinum]KAJ5961231.1 hypothetical protein N7479_008381 [Penicillium vulpinum]
MAGLHLGHRSEGRFPAPGVYIPTPSRVEPNAAPLQLVTRWAGIFLQVFGFLQSVRFPRIFRERRAA